MRIVHETKHAGHVGRDPPNPARVHQVVMECRAQSLGGHLGQKMNECFDRFRRMFDRRGDCKEADPDRGTFLSYPGPNTGDEPQRDLVPAQPAA